MNQVLLTGRLTRDPELRSLASGKSLTQFTVATREHAGEGREHVEHHNVVVWDRLAEIAGRYLGKGQTVGVIGALRTRTWDDERGIRHWRTEVVATSIEMLTGARKADYTAEADQLAVELNANRASA